MIVLDCIIEYRPIVEAAQRQTGLDFQALRSMQPQADSVYNDFVMFEDNYPSCHEYLRTSALNHLHDSLSGNITQLCRDWKHGVEENRHARICFTTERTKVIQSVVEVAIKEVLKYDLLAWWYKLRNSNLYTHYAQQYTAAISELQSSMASSHIYSVGSYY